MRNLTQIILPVMLVACVASASAQMRDSLLTHYVGLEAHIGYSNLFTRQAGLHDIGGVGGGLGVAYKFQYRPWRFQTGLTVTSLNSLSRGEWYSSTPVTSPYPSMTLNERYEDVRYIRHAISISLPVKAGYRIGDWTLMAGVRASYPIWQNANYSGKRASTITDEQLIDELRDMPNHGLVTSPFEEVLPRSMGPDLTVEAELIWDLDKYLAYHPKKKSRKSRKKTFKELLHYEVSVFASAGVLNSGTAANPLNSLFIGGRFAVFYEFEHPKPKKKPSQSKPRPKPKPTPAPKPVVPSVKQPVQQDTIFYGEQVIQQGDTVVLQNLYFATNKVNVLPSSGEALDELYTFLVANPDMRIRITGHTDNTASREYNLRLSKGRAEAVKQEMVKRGIDPNRIETDGKGMDEPVADNSTEEGRQQNRRVELIVL